MAGRLIAAISIVLLAMPVDAARLKDEDTIRSLEDKEFKVRPDRKSVV